MPVQGRGGDGASAKRWASSAALEGSLNVIEGVANMSALETRMGLSV